MPTEATVHQLPVPTHEVPAPTPRIGLSGIEHLAVTRMLGDSDLDVTIDRVTSLATEDAARRRLVARHIGVLDSQLGQVGVALADAIARGDDGAVRRLDRAATGMTKRMTMLIEQLREESSGGKKRAVFVMAGELTVDGG